MERELQLELKLSEGSSPAQTARPTLWLIAADRDDVKAMSADLQAGASVPQRLSFFISADDGECPIASNDVLLLRNGCRIDVYSSSCATQVQSAAFIRSLSNLFSRAGLVRARSPRAKELLFVRMSGNGRPTRGPLDVDGSLAWTLSRLQNVGPRANAYLVDRLAQETLEAMPHDASPITRAMFSRLRADALAQILALPLDDDVQTWGEAAKLYGDAADNFKSGSLVRQAVSCKRLQRETMTYACSEPSADEPFLPGLPAPLPPAKRSVMGFRARRCLGIALEPCWPLALPMRPSASRSHVYDQIGSLAVEDVVLLACLSHTRSERLRPSVTLETSDEFLTEGTLRVALDEEHFVMMGLGGRRGGAIGWDDQMIVTVSSPACEFAPHRAVLRIGQSGEFSVRSRLPGRHKISVQVASTSGDYAEVHVPIGGFMA